MISQYASNPMPIGTLSDIQNRDSQSNTCKKIQCLAQTCLAVVAVLAVGCVGVIAVTNSMEFDEKSLDVRNVAKRILAGCLGAAYGSAMLFLVSMMVRIPVEMRYQRPSLNQQV